MNFEKIKKPIARFFLWAARVLIREGKEEMAKFAVEEVLQDEKIPDVNHIGEFVRKKFPARIGSRGF